MLGNKSNCLVKHERFLKCNTPTRRIKPPTRRIKPPTRRIKPERHLSRCEGLDFVGRPAGHGRSQMKETITSLGPQSNTWPWVYKVIHGYSKHAFLPIFLEQALWLIVFYKYMVCFITFRDSFWKGSPTTPPVQKKNCSSKNCLATKTTTNFRIPNHAFHVLPGFLIYFALFCFAWASAATRCTILPSCPSFSSRLRPFAKAWLEITSGWEEMLRSMSSKGKEILTPDFLLWISMHK